MDRRRILAAAAAWALLAGTIPAASAQPARLKDAILGAWTLVAASTVRPDGSSTATPYYGPHAKGAASFTRDGRFSIALVNPDIPKYTSNDRQKPTAGEAMATASGSNVLSGSYSVNGADRTLLLHVEASSYPNDNGTDQTIIVKSVGPTELVLVHPGAPNGGAIELAFSRAE